MSYSSETEEHLTKIKSIKYSEKKLTKTQFIFKDELYEIRWVIDLTKFVHPLGLVDFAYIDKDITEKFNRNNHGNEQVNLLLLKAIGVLE